MRELVGQICQQNEVSIIKGHLSKDHIHILLSCSPSLAVSRLVQKLKGASSHKLFSKFAHSRKQYWEQHLWSRVYFVSSAGAITDEIIKKYIENQEPTQLNDDFCIGS
jgi:putative transposase